MAWWWPFGDGSTDPGVVALEQNMSCFSRCSSPSLKNNIEITYPLKIGLPIFFHRYFAFHLFLYAGFGTSSVKFVSDVPRTERHPEIQKYGQEFWLDIQKHTTLSINLLDLKSLVATADPFPRTWSARNRQKESSCFWRVLGPWFFGPTKRKTTFQYFQCNICMSRGIGIFINLNHCSITFAWQWFWGHFTCHNFTRMPWWTASLDVLKQVLDADQGIVIRQLRR